MSDHTNKTETLKPAKRETDAQAVEREAYAEERETHVLESEAESLIKSYAIATLAVAAVPVPLFDFVAITAVQLHMIRRLAHLYGKPFGEEIGASVVSALASTLIGGLGSYATVGLLRLIPVVGQAASLAGTSITAGAATYAIGRVFENHFRLGGTLLSFEAAAVKTSLREHYETGKAVVKHLVRRGEQEAAAAAA